MSGLILMILILKVNMKKKFLDLGMQPLANSFLHNIKKKNLKKEYFYNSNFQKKIRAATFGNIYHVTTPGTLLKKKCAISL